MIYTYYELTEEAYKYLCDNGTELVYSRYWFSHTESKFNTANIYLITHSLRIWEEEDGCVTLIKNEGVGNTEIDLEEFLYIKLKSRHVI